ncbi:hypothetical protein MPSEU_000371200 [Mayamaea pseudoterrestris]|nr:hypothetical protein MPSEU_000371200 [Mayamaea pseudoterrestris]
MDLLTMSSADESTGSNEQAEEKKPAQNMKNGKNGNGRRPSSSTRAHPHGKKRRLSISSQDKLQRRLKKSRNEVKAEFDSKKEAILSECPKQWKDMFGEIGFTRWSGKVYSCIVLNPYQIPPSDVRRKFYKSFSELRKQGRLDELPFLIYFYGEQNINQMYSFILKDKFTPFEKGKEKKDYFPVLLQSRKKQEAGKKLTKMDEYNLRALQEIEDDLTTDKIHRRILPFPEEYDLLSETDLLDVESGSSSESDSNDGPPVVDRKVATKPLAKKRKKMIIAKKQPTKLPVAVLKTSDKSPTLNSMMPAGSQTDTDDFVGDADDEDEANLQYALGDSDIEDVDNENDSGWLGAVNGGFDEMELSTDLVLVEKPAGKRNEGKAKGKEAKEMPVKSRKLTRKKPRKELSPAKAEKRSFVRCERMYRMFVFEWETAVHHRNLVTLSECFERASAVVADCSAPFLEAYFADLVKLTKSMLRDSTSEAGNEALFISIKRIGKELKDLYAEKKAKVPIGFKVPKAKPFSDLIASASIDTKPFLGDHEAQLVGNTNVDSDQVEKTRVADQVKQSRAIAHVARSLSPVDDCLRSSGPLDIPPTEADESKELALSTIDRKAFSLGYLKTRSEIQPVVENGAEDTDFKQQSNCPAWMTDATTNAPIDDSIRALALTFIQDMATHLSPEIMNVAAVVLAIEIAVFEWAKKVGAAMGGLNAKAPDDESVLVADAPWLDVYWNRIHAIVAAVCGLKGTGNGTVRHLITCGHFPTAESIASLSDEQLKRSSSGHAIY